MKYAVVFSVIALAVASTGPAVAENIDWHGDGHQYGWTENVGWINLEAELSGSGISVVSSGANALQGHAWLENVGWLNFGDAPTTPPQYSNSVPGDCGVNLNTATGALSGYAWGENIGWVNFEPGVGNVVISKLTGEFSGKAWGENVGWISFDGLSTAVANTDPVNVPVAISHLQIE